MLYSEVLSYDKLSENDLYLIGIYENYLNFSDKDFINYLKEDYLQNFFNLYDNILKKEEVFNPSIHKLIYSYERFIMIDTDINFSVYYKLTREEEKFYKTRY